MGSESGRPGPGVAARPGRVRVQVPARHAVAVQGRRRGPGVDPRGTAFVIFAVVTGMAVGAGRPTLALVALPIIGLAAWLLSQWGRVPKQPANGRATLVVRLGIGLDPDALLAPILSRYLAEFR